ncbi:MAG: creatininase family protein [Candidatus Dormibacteraceae bacterium]
MGRADRARVAGSGGIGLRIVDMNWMQVEKYLEHDDRAVLPLGSVEQHGYLSLGTDALLAERVAVEAAEPLAVPVFPVQAYGVTPYTLGFPGSLSLSVGTYVALITELLDGMHRAGFRRLVLVNGHGGNAPGGAVAQEWLIRHEDSRVVLHNWWNAPRTWAAAQAIDALAAHGSWLESFPWNRVAEAPAGQKSLADLAAIRASGPVRARELLGDGNFGGDYQKPDAQMLHLWEVGVEETREVIDGIR